MIDIMVGRKLRDIRLNKKITLQKLSEETGLSVSYLSLMERGLNSPTIANLQKVCNILGITLADLLTKNDNNLLVRKNERRKIFEAETGVLYEAITEGNRNIQAICMTVYDNLEHISECHVTDEFGYISHGSMVMYLDGRPFDLREGDSIYIPAETPHYFRKTSDEPCVSIWCFHNKDLEHDEKNWT